MASALVRICRNANTQHPYTCPSPSHQQLRENANEGAAALWAGAAGPGLRTGSWMCSARVRKANTNPEEETVSELSAPGRANACSLTSPLNGAWEEQAANHKLTGSRTTGQWGSVSQNTNLSKSWRFQEMEAGRCKLAGLGAEGLGGSGEEPGERNDWVWFKNTNP